MPLCRKSKVIVHYDVQQLSGFNDFTGHLNICTAWCEVSRRVIMGENNAGSTQIQRTFQDFTHIGLHPVHSTFPKTLIPNKCIMAV